MVEQLILGCHSPIARRRALQIAPTTMDECLRVLTDDAAHQDPILPASQPLSKSPVGPVHDTCSRVFSEPLCKPQAGYSQSSHLRLCNGGKTKGKYCFHCGLANHTAGSDHCPAMDTQCRFCCKIGHYELVCFAKRHLLEAPVAPSGIWK